MRCARAASREACQLTASYHGSICTMTPAMSTTSPTPMTMGLYRGRFKLGAASLAAAERQAAAHNHNSRSKEQQTELGRDAAASRRGRLCRGRGDADRRSRGNRLRDWRRRGGGSRQRRSHVEGCGRRAEGRGRRRGPSERSRGRSCRGGSRSCCRRRRTRRWGRRRRCGCLAADRRRCGVEEYWDLEHSFGITDQRSSVNEDRACATARRERWRA